jgi:hypothetical protein
MQLFEHNSSGIKDVRFAHGNTSSDFITIIIMTVFKK